MKKSRRPWVDPFRSDPHVAALSLPVRTCAVGHDSLDSAGLLATLGVRLGDPLEPETLFVAALIIGFPMCFTTLAVLRVIPERSREIQCLRCLDIIAEDGLQLRSELPTIFRIRVLTAHL